jgi:hypothetical protein
MKRSSSAISATSPSSAECQEHRHEASRIGPPLGRGQRRDWQGARPRNGRVAIARGDWSMCNVMRGSSDRPSRARCEVHREWTCDNTNAEPGCTPIRSSELRSFRLAKIIRRSFSLVLGLLIAGLGCGGSATSTGSGSSSTTSTSSSSTGIGGSLTSSSTTAGGGGAGAGGVGGTGIGGAMSSSGVGGQLHDDEQLEHGNGRLLQHDSGRRRGWCWRGRCWWGRCWWGRCWRGWWNGHRRRDEQLRRGGQWGGVVAVAFAASRRDRSVGPSGLEMATSHRRRSPPIPTATFS